MKSLLLALPITLLACSCNRTGEPSTADIELTCIAESGQFDCGADTYVVCENGEGDERAACGDEGTFTTVFEGEDVWFVYIEADGEYLLNEATTISAVERRLAEVRSEIADEEAAAYLPVPSDAPPPPSEFEYEFSPAPKDAVGVDVTADADGNLTFTNYAPRFCGATLWSGSETKTGSMMVAPGASIPGPVEALIPALQSLVTGQDIQWWTTTTGAAVGDADGLTIYCSLGPTVMMAMLKDPVEMALTHPEILAQVWQMGVNDPATLAWVSLAEFWSFIARFLGPLMDPLMGSLDNQLACGINVITAMHGGLISCSASSSDDADAWGQCAFNDVLLPLWSRMTEVMVDCASDDSSTIKRAFRSVKRLFGIFLSLEIASVLVEDWVPDALYDYRYEGTISRWDSTCIDTNPGYRSAFQTVGQEFGFDDHSDCLDSSSCSCETCSSDGYLRSAAGADVDGLRAFVPLSSIVDDSGEHLDVERLEPYLDLSDCLGRPVLLNIAVVLPNYSDAPVDSFPTAWSDLQYVSYEIPEGGIGTTRIPIFWDDEFLRRYASVIAELGALYDGDPRIASILVGYGLWGEMVLDQRAHYANSDEGYTAIREEWESFGFTEDSWLSAIVEISEAYGRSFAATPLIAQITDPGVLVFYDAETYDEEEAAGFPMMEAYLTSVVDALSGTGIDSIQFSGLAARSTYGTDRPVYAALEHARDSFDIAFEAFLYSGRDTVEGCDPGASTGGELARSGCTDPDELACALYRADRYGAKAVTLWANEWTESEALSVVESWRAGESMACSWCTEAATVTATELRVPKIFCPASEPPELRGSLPGMDWETGVTVEDDGDAWTYALDGLPLGGSYELNMTPCDTTWGWLSIYEWLGTCGDVFGEWVHCKTGDDAGCNLYFYIDETGEPSPCDDATCTFSIDYPQVAHTTSNAFEIEVESAYLPGATCAEAVGELPDWSWSSGVESHGTGSHGGFLFLLPETPTPSRFTFRDCSDTSLWAGYAAACEDGSGGGFCWQNDDGTWSLRVTVDSAGVLTPEGTY